MSRFILLDFETTGFDPATCDIIEIGAVRVEGLEDRGRYSTFVRPDHPIPPFVRGLTGITDEDVASAPSLKDVVPELLEFLGDLPIVAHNASMERRFLEQRVSPFAASPRRYELHNSIEPLALVYPESPSHSMETMRELTGLSSEGAHRALTDCEDLLEVLKRARAWATKERPGLEAVIKRFLGADSGWWWHWYFDGIGGARPGAGDGPELGDLRELRSEDAGREIDWSRAVEGDEIRAALRSGTGGFERREGQERMAVEVASALSAGDRVAIEAPTGTGKSVAYLLPGALAAERTGAPLVVATRSKGLQDQLLAKDIPRVAGLLARDGAAESVRASVVKGQENYFCLRKLHEAGDYAAATPSGEGGIGERWAAAYLVALSETGHAVEIDRVSRYLKGEFPGLGAWLDQVRSHHTTTIGPGCPFYDRCHFFNSARLAHRSDVVIANHALVFRWPGHLPKIRNVVFDEAHHLEEQITEAHSSRLSEEDLSRSVDRLSRKRGSRRGGTDLEAMAPILDDLDSVSELADAVRPRLAEVAQAAPLAVAGSGGEHVDFGGRGGVAVDRLRGALEDLAGSVERLRDSLAGAFEKAREARAPGADPTDRLAADLAAGHVERLSAHARVLRAALDSGAENSLRLLHFRTRENAWRLEISPIEVAELSKPFFDSFRSIILTSATLSAGGKPDFLLGRIGFAPSKPFVSLPSPYPLEKQAAAFIPLEIPMPGTPEHLEALIAFTAEAAERLGGRTLVLIASNARLRTAAERLGEILEPKGIAVHDSLSEPRAAEAFLASPRAVLVGGERYGEGLDIPGPALSCVIIEKINEAMTRGPLQEARKARTKFPIYDYDFPLRMMWLRQRAGRLIRSATDKGTIVIFDPRFHGWKEGSQRLVRAALAPIRLFALPRERILNALVTVAEGGVPERRPSDPVR